MYLDHFKLQSKPFELIPDPAFLHFSKKHQLALTMLEYGLTEQSGISVITGEIGSGKTTVLQHVINRLSEKEFTIGLINHTHESLGNLCFWIAMALNIPHQDKDKVTLFKDIQDFVIAEYAKGKRVLLVVDEAQNMTASALEDLRLFTNINGNRDFLLQIILVGQPELKTLLIQPALAQIAQRVSVEYHIDPLSWEETKAYVNHRVETAGSEKALFDETAIAVIFYYSGGIPRLINTLSDYALVHAFALDEAKVTLQIALDAIEGRNIGGVNRFVKYKDQCETIREQILNKLGVDISRSIDSAPLIKGS